MQRMRSPSHRMDVIVSFLHFTIGSRSPLWGHFRRFHPRLSAVDVGSSPQAPKRGRPRRVALGQIPVIQTPELGARIIRYELADYEWTALKPMLPNKPRDRTRLPFREQGNQLHSAWPANVHRRAHPRRQKKTPRGWWRGFLQPAAGFRARAANCFLSSRIAYK